jgi:RNA polymerase sigma factor (sigma-70 family)
MSNNNAFIEGFLNGDPQVFKKIYDACYTNVIQYISARGGSKKQAEEIFQNALVQLYVKLKDNQLSIQSFEDYLFVVCINLWRRENKIKNRVTNIDAVPLKDESVEKATFYIEQMQWDLYQEKFRELSQQCQNILQMIFNKQPYSEIVKIYKYASENAARQRVFKCKARLIALIKKDKRYNDFKKK